MLSWRAKRQVIAVLIAGVLMGGAVFIFVSKFFPQPSCFDNRRNQGEIEVDCGGPCTPCELRNPKTPIVFWAKAVPVRPNTYDVVAEVENPNEKLSSSEFEYEFILFDSLGPIAVKKGKTFILPSEKIHIIETAIKTSRDANSVEFRTLKTGWQVKEISIPNVIAEQREYKVREVNGRRQSIVEANIFNQSPLRLKDVEMGVLVFDDEGNVVGVNRIFIESFSPDTRKSITAVWPEELKGEIAKVIVEPRINVFGPSIFLKSH